MQGCNGHGVCQAGATAGHTCTCFPGYTGADCSRCDSGYEWALKSDDCDGFGVCQPVELECGDLPPSSGCALPDKRPGNPDGPYPYPGPTTEDSFGEGAAGCGPHGSCHEHGHCWENQCSCYDGYFGDHCQEAGCPISWSMDQCWCCPSGVLNKRGQCCQPERVHGRNPRPVLDAAGECCAAGFVDACGVCGGAGVYVDRDGTCCPVRPALTLQRRDTSRGSFRAATLTARLCSVA